VTALAFVNAKMSLIAIENPISNDLFINSIIDNQLLCLKPIIHIEIIEVYEVYNVIRSIVLLNSIANNTNRSGDNQHDMYKSSVLQYVFSPFLFWIYKFKLRKNMLCCTINQFLIINVVMQIIY
jgi:hypothetical protein